MECQDFPSKSFCPTVSKNSVGESFNAALISDIEKVWIRAEGVSRFSVQKFLTLSADFFRKGIFHCCINLGYRKSLDKCGVGEYQDSPSSFLCLTVPKIFVGEPFCAVFQEVSGSQKVFG